MWFSRIPFKQKLLIIIPFVIPLMFDNTDGSLESIWLVYLIPPLVLAYHFGLKGGLMTALVGTAVHIIWATKDFIWEGSQYNPDSLFGVTHISLAVFVVAIGIGLLADKLKQKHKELEDALLTSKYMAFHDELSDLPNRRLFEERLNHALSQASRNQHMIAVMFFDLDRFKYVNDTMGHAFGDLLIAAMGKRLKGCMREGDTVARMGGDEFTIIAENIVEVKDITNVAQRVVEALQDPFNINGREKTVTISGGISVYPTDGVSAQDLMKRADAAMYRAKEQGRNNYCFFSTDMDKVISRRIKIEENLREDFEQGRLTLHYQPQVNSKTRELTGMEALIRWHNSDLGNVSPGEFIPIAEEIGLIVAIGNWVLLTACNQAKKWQVNGYPPIRVSVNVSPIQLRQKDFADIVQQTLAETGLNPRFLELEITETVTLAKLENINEQLSRLRNVGVLISMDDFGTGYSSLDYLKKLPIDSLKIDLSFTKDIAVKPKSKELVGGIIALAKIMGFRITAEGVESVQQLSIIRELECDEIQGYIYGKPMPPELFEQQILVMGHSGSIKLPGEGGIAVV